MSLQEGIKKDLGTIELKFDEPLSYYTYTKTGGPADVLAFPTSTEETQEIVKYCNAKNIPWLVLGNASNLIVRDGGIRGFVIMLSKMNKIQIENDQIVAAAGSKIIDVSYKALAHQLSGLEFACGIPGSVGGAVYMNAGAYEGEIRQVFTSAHILLPDGKLVVFNQEDMKFSYRRSILQEMKGIVLAVTFTCCKGETKEIEKKMQELTFLRESKQPLEYPSCGSVFKRPEGHFTGKLIQDAGLQGLKWGGAQISEKHAGFIVNIDQATATDYIELIQHIQQVILAKYGVTLETEVRIIGEE